MVGRCFGAAVVLWLLLLSFVRLWVRCWCCRLWCCWWLPGAVVLGLLLVAVRLLYGRAVAGWCQAWAVAVLLPAVVLLVLLVAGAVAVCFACCWLLAVAVGCSGVVCLPAVLLVVVRLLVVVCCCRWACGVLVVLFGGCCAWVGCRA
jgi:hypothetical protein